MYLKDKEDLSYPEPPVLDMKWENCDANVAEQVNIPKFSKRPLSDFLSYSLIMH